MSYRTHVSVWSRYWYCTEIIEVSGTGFDVVPKWSKCPVPASMSYRTYLSVRYWYWSHRSDRRVRYRYWFHAEGTEVSGTGNDVVPKLSKCSAPVLMSYRSYRSVRHRYWYRTERTEASGTVIDVVPKLPKFPVPVWKSVPVPTVPVPMSYRNYRSIRYWYCGHTEVTEVPGTGMKACTGDCGTVMHVLPKLPKVQLPVSMSYRSYRCGIDVLPIWREGPVAVITAVWPGTYRTEHTFFVCCSKGTLCIINWKKSDRLCRRVALNLKADK